MLCSMLTWHMMTISASGALASRSMQLVVASWQSEGVIDPLPAAARLARQSWPDGKLLLQCMCRGQCSKQVAPCSLQVLSDEVSASAELAWDASALDGAPLAV